MSTDSLLAALGQGDLPALARMVAVDAELLNRPFGLVIAPTLLPHPCAARKPTAGCSSWPPLAPARQTGEVALHHAADRGDCALVQFLLDHGADPRRTDDVRLAATQKP